MSSSTTNTRPTVTIAQKAGEQDQLFGSVTAQDIVNGLAAQNFTIERRRVLLEDPIKQLGDYQVPVRLHKDVNAQVTVKVVREE